MGSRDSEQFKIDAQIFRAKLASAPFREQVSAVGKAAVQWVKDHPEMVIGALVGGGGAALAEHKLVKKDPKTGQSINQANSRDAVRHHEHVTKKMKEEGKEPGLMHGMAGASARFSKELADVTAEHPKKTALLAIPSGVALGTGAGALIRKYLRK